MLVKWQKLKNFKTSNAMNWFDIPLEDKYNKASHWFEYRGEKLYLPMNWNLVIDWENKKYTYDKIEKYPTLNDIKANGEDIRLSFPYEECESPMYGYDVDNFNPQDVVKFFEEHGYKVTLKAVQHNFNAWCGDLKSGYRDNINGYHLFTPCRCNPLRFSLTTLHPTQDWQNTFAC